MLMQLLPKSSPLHINFRRSFQVSRECKLRGWPPAAYAGHSNTCDESLSSVDFNHVHLTFMLLMDGAKRCISCGGAKMSHMCASNTLQGFDCLLLEELGSSMQLKTLCMQHTMVFKQTNADQPRVNRHELLYTFPEATQCRVKPWRPAQHTIKQFISAMLN